MSTRFVRGPVAASVAIISAGLPGCARTGPSTAVITRDSAGVRIVESTRPAWGEDEGWSVDSMPSLDLTRTGAGAPHEFFRVADATRLDDGRIAVANRGSAEVRVYAPDGTHLRTVGRKGEGPGEFDRIESIHAFRGDSLLAWDFWLGRATMIDPEDGGVRTYGSRATNFMVRHLLVLGGDRLVGIGYGLDVDVENGVYRLPYVVFTFDADGASADTIARLAGYESFQFDEGDGQPLFAHDGQVAAHDGRLYIGDADSMRFEVRAPDGTLERIVDVPGYDLRLSSDAVAAERRARMPGPEAPPFIRRAVESMPDPATRPAYSRLLVDPDGNVWAPRYHGYSEADLPTDCIVFDADGAWLGSVRLPARFTPLEIGADYVLGVRRDDVDAEHVEMLRLDRSGSAS